MTDVTEALSVGQLRRDMAKRLRDAFATEGRHGTPSLDARLLLAHALDRDANSLVLVDDHPVADDVVERAVALLARRIAGEPVARILGHKEFWGLDFLLSPDTLVPRPDTETLVETALEAIDAAGWRQRPLRLLDIGTGSGAILLALLSELPEASGIGTDASSGATRTAGENARRLGLFERADFRLTNWADGVTGTFPVIVSNPPYVKSRAIDALAVEVRDHDPRQALDGGSDGLAAYRTILADLSRLMDAGGHAFLEVGAGQAEDVTGLARTHGFEAVCHQDLAAVDRVVHLTAGQPARHRIG